MVVPVPLRLEVREEVAGVRSMRDGPSLTSGVPPTGSVEKGRDKGRALAPLEVVVPLEGTPVRALIDSSFARRVPPWP